jgi:crossover junction endodeoxyribonuclease RuvC
LTDSSTPLSNKIILGIDPGTVIMGYGLIAIDNRKISLITLGILRLSKFDDHALRLKKIFERTLALAEEYKPDVLAIEAPFYGKNVQSMLKLGRAQGVAMAAALYRDIPIQEYTPREIKKSITGNGTASKQQVAAMLTQLTNYNLSPETLDATDGLAAAVCHHLKSGNLPSGKGYNSWKSFLKDNPDRFK